MPCFSVQTASLPHVFLPISRHRRGRGRLLSHSVMRPHHQSSRSTTLIDLGTLRSLSPGHATPRASTSHANSLRNPSQPPVLMSNPFDYDFSQWGQPLKHSSDEWRHLAPSPYVDTSSGPESESTSVESRTYVDTAGDTNIVPISRLGECLPPLSVFQNFDQCPSCFDASQFCHKMRLSRHLSDICVGGQA